ncbi:unnamed protein product [Periconia digitata]|uniref:Uncharacterized protein n=1 Tax=Periconia digitata TaxID=1303443 RepID=A0A9W4XJ21_9PLEO|nr:unnamed protein product [Periconia digitata]
MTRQLDFPSLSLELPNSRMSVDFTKFTASKSPVNSRHPQSDKSALRLPHNYSISRRPLPNSSSLNEVPEEPSSTITTSKVHPRRRWAIFPSTPEHPHPQNSTLSRASSNASTSSSASGYSTTASSVFSRTQSTSTTFSADTSQYSLEHTRRRNDTKKQPTTLTSLPSHLLEHILSYALCLPLNVSIGPRNADDKHMQYRYHHAGVDYIDVRLIRKHPIFLVSHRIRDAALYALHDRCTFIIDLHSIYHSRVCSTVHDNLKKHKHFWLDERPPQMVRDTLRSLSRINIRLPVASCDDIDHLGRGEKENIGGSSGDKGGPRSLKKEKEDAVRIERYLEAILSLIWADNDAMEESRGRSSSLGRGSGSLRKRSTSRFRGKSRNRSSRDNESSRPVSRGRSNPVFEEDDHKRQPLKRLEVVFVKRSPSVMVLPETLQYVKHLRTLKVSGLTKYFLELEEQKVIFATKYGKRWRGIEPDGTRLLNDLQSLSITPNPDASYLSSIEGPSTRIPAMPILHTLDTQVPAASERPITSPSHASSPLSKSLLRNPLNWGKKKHKRKDSFSLLDESMGERGAMMEPPSIDELKKIAEDVRNGLY